MYSLSDQQKKSLRDTLPVLDPDCKGLGKDELRVIVEFLHKASMVPRSSTVSVYNKPGSRKRRKQEIRHGPMTPSNGDTDDCDDFNSMESQGMYSMASAKLDTLQKTDGETVQHTSGDEDTERGDREVNEEEDGTQWYDDEDDNEGDEGEQDGGEVNDDEADTADTVVETPYENSDDDEDIQYTVR